jgi:hypothetical protein
MRTTVIVLGVLALLTAGAQAPSAVREARAGEYGWSAASVIRLASLLALGAIAILVGILL